MTTVDRISSKDNLAAPPSRTPAKSPVSFTASLASNDTRDDDLAKWSESPPKSRNSEDGRSDASSSHRQRMSRIFKGRSKRRQSATSQDDFSNLNDSPEDVPPVPHVRRPSAEPRNMSDDSLGLHDSVTSSLFTQDSDSDASPAKRPGISPHQSHTGLLTHSSPLIASEALDSLASSTNASPADSVASTEELSIRHSKTVDLAANKRGVSPSPVGRLKEAFAPTRRSTSPNKPGTDVNAARPSTRKKREVRVLDRPLQASPPQIQIEPPGQLAPSLRSTGPKRIITQLPATPPNLIDAPTTFVTPPTPTEGRAASPTHSDSGKEGSKQGTSQSKSNVTVSPSGNMISHRRVRSATNPPSKLSNSITAPLTPHPEEAKTPGGTAFAPPQNPGGFFASVFSAAQNAANNISNTIANNPANKGKPNQQQQTEEVKKAEGDGEEVIGPDNTNTSVDSAAEKRRPAVETLGSGNLSLAALGISEQEISPMSSSTNVTMKADEASAKAEDIAATQAVSAAYAAEMPASVHNERPRSHTANSGSSVPVPPSPQKQSEITDSPAASSIQRQGSVRSRISDRRKRRHRGSSAATGNTIGAAVASSGSTLAPSAAINGNRLNGTGFAVAPVRRNRDFHNLFKSVPEDDYLIEDYSAALQKEILLHGRLYVSEGHLCFSSNILGWVTNLVISFDEVVSVEKKSTAVLFPNAIVIQTLHARNVFASFLARDSTYDLIIGIWKISHPNLKSSLNGTMLDSGGTGDKTEKAESVGSEDGSLQDSDDDVYDEDEDEDDGMGSFTDPGEGSIAGSDIVPAVGTEAASQAVGGYAAINSAAGPATHGFTDCGDSDQHYDKLLIDTTIPAPLGKVHSLLFGPASGAFMRKWLVEDQKSLDLQMEDDKKGLGDDKKTFNLSYIKPLSAPCNIAMTLEQYDLEKAVTVQCSTGTPDTRNTTRLIMTFTVEWSGKSWLRGPIEKGASDGQMSYATSLTAALRTAVTAKAAPARALGKGGKGKKRSKTGALDEAPVAVSAPVPASQIKQSNWGLLEPVRSLLGPFSDIIESLFAPQVVITILGALLIYSWFFRGVSTPVGPNQWSTAQRQVAYDEIWRHEESELWKWLEDRVALDRVQASVAGGSLHQDSDSHIRLPPVNMKERDRDEAVRITEERLKVLKNKINKDKLKTRTKSLKE
ncbi:hypothetical protein GQ44DRAFT_716393 [Phaeosphaeriaceae sp. PMI808]|nr:hypothetical protein GQ44DRAFT_716393 [Phaeosphaeriaceae sp. PMI808]